MWPLHQRAVPAPSLVLPCPHLAQLHSCDRLPVLRCTAHHPSARHTVPHSFDRHTVLHSIDRHTVPHSFDRHTVPHSFDCHTVPHSFDCQAVLLFRYQERIKARLAARARAMAQGVNPSKWSAMLKKHRRTDSEEARQAAGGLGAAMRRITTDPAALCEWQ